jgi:hypothetical protein
MAQGIPEYYLGGTPQSTQGLSPLQLALADILRKGTDVSLFVNPDFITEMQRFTDSKQIYPANVNEQYNYNGVWDGWNDGRLDSPSGYQGARPTSYPTLNLPSTGITGTNFIIIGDEIFVQRVAQDCGPDEELRYELVQVGKRAEIAQGTFAVYGKIVYKGSLGIPQDSGPIF